MTEQQRQTGGVTRGKAAGATGLVGVHLERKRRKMNQAGFFQAEAVEKRSTAQHRDMDILLDRQYAHIKTMKERHGDGFRPGAAEDDIPSCRILAGIGGV